MKKFNLLLILFICLLQNQSFSQKSKPDIKPDPIETKKVIKNQESKAYCLSTYSNQTDDWITNVTFNSINNYSGQDGPDSYGDYTYLNTGLLVGSTYTLSVTFVSNGYTEHVWAWFDWNGDEDFYDAGEAYDLGEGVDATKTLNITVPAGATVGFSRMRIIEQYNSNPGPCDPHYNNYGETEDYSIYINSNNYCGASGGCDEYISEVSINALWTPSGCDGYMDYTPLVTWMMPVNTSALITVTNGNPYSPDQCGIWVDWNRDDDFYDANETITVIGTPGMGPYTATLTAPPGATFGTCTVRIRLTYTGLVDPCGITPYGEVEDHSVTLIPEVPAEWTGAVDNNWHNADNWNTTNYPDATTDVIIPNVTTKCYVYAMDADCKNLTIESGTAHDLRIYDKDLTVHGNMQIFGMLTMDHPLGDLEVEGSIYWEAGSSAYMSGYSGIWIHGDWIFKYGSNVHLDDGLVSFEGSGGSYLRNFSYNCYFHDIAVYKNGGDWLSISSNTTYDLNINGNLFLQPDAIVYVYSPHPVYLRGDLYNSGYLYCYDGYFFFDGNVQEINENISYSTTTLFHHLVISSTTSTTILNKDIYVNNNLTIESGQFIPNDLTITVDGYWNNQVGPAGFVEGNGRVIFTGTSSYIFGDENFNILELNKSTYFDLLQIDGNTVTCQHYDWTNGSVSVRLGGEFTAYDLIDNGIYGGWGVDNTGGTINISNYGAGQWVDLNGYISLTGGTMNVYGGDGISYWPFNANAEIHMMDGVLDFHDQGILVHDPPSYTLTENITGGTIRTAGGFWGQTNDFTPDYGTIELYGGTDAYIYTINGCYLNNVIINKSTKESTKAISHIKSKTNPQIDERSGKSIGNGTKSNTITQQNFLDMNGSLVINNGVLNSNGFNIHLEEDWTNNVGDAGFIESTGWVAFVGYNKVSVIHTNETFHDLALSNASSGIFGLTIANSLTVNVTNSLELFWSTLEMNYDSELHIGGDVYIADGAGLNADDGYNVISVGGNWTNENYSNTQYYGFWPGGEIITFDGTTDQIINTNTPEEAFTNITIDKAGGYFRPNDNIKINGGLHIQDGDWWDFSAGLNHYFVVNILIEPNGGYFPQGTSNFIGLNYQTYENNGGQAQFGDVIIDKHYTKNKVKGSAKENGLENTKAGTLELNSQMVVFNGHTTTIEEGTLDLNGNSFKSDGDIYINDGGIMEVDAGAWLSIVTGLFVNNGGQFTAAGVSGNNAHIWKDVIGYYEFQVKSGGTISANYADFDDMNENGIWVQDGAFIDPANPFSNCNFIDGINTTNSARLVINTDQVLNINNINFNNNPYVAGAYNIGKAIYQGEVNITTTGGDFTGPLYEYDPDNRIHWTDYVHGLWTGNVSSDWFDPMNWGDFNVPGTATDVVIPAGVPNYPVVNNSTAYCQTLTIEAGATLEIGNDELHIANYFDNYGQLIMTNSLAKLHVLNFFWLPGSTANITTGEIYASTWTWGNGTNASLGTGNTVHLSWSIFQADTDAAFGNLVLESGNSANGSDPVRVSGNLTMSLGALWDTYADWIIDGDWIIGYSASLDVMDGAQVVCNSSLTLDSELYILNTSVVTVHGMLYFNNGGFLVIDDGTFICDYTLSSGWIEILGGINMTSGSVEFPDANISFAGSQYISGGTIITGRSVRANPAGAFQPTGGKLELVGSGIGHYLQITNGNYLNELFVNRSAPIGIHPGSPLTTQGYVVIYSELMVQGNTLTSYGDIDIGGGGGVLNINENAVLEMADNKWLAINMNGTLEVIGSPGNEATITHTTGHYVFWIGNGATISAEHAVFEYMTSEGIFLNPGAMVDLAHPFDNCTFRNGIAGGSLLTINSNQNFTATDAIFPANTWVGAYNVFKNSTPGDVTFINATGGFAGPAYEFDPYNHVHWGAVPFSLDVTVFLEGPFNPATNLMIHDPSVESILNQPFGPALPYFGNPLPDWYYTGSESISAPFPANVTDWVLVELRDAPDVTSALPVTSIAQQAAFVTTDGKVVDLDGSSMLNFSASVSDGLFIVVWQRNHSGLISTLPLPIPGPGTIVTYDFSSGSGQAHGGTSAQKLLSTVPDIWGMFSGDGDGSGDIDMNDKINVWSLQTGNSGYLESDFNLNGQSNNADKNDYWLPNLGEGSFIPE